MTQVNNNSFQYNMNITNCCNNPMGNDYSYLLRQPIGDTLSLSSNTQQLTLLQNTMLQLQIMMIRLLLIMRMLDIQDDGYINGSLFKGVNINNLGIQPRNLSTNTTTGVPRTFKNYPPGTIKSMITEKAKAKGIPPAIALALFEKESGFNPNAIGDGGQAVGLGQLHPAAAREGGISPAERSDPEKNIEASLNYLKQRYNETGDWREALGAYNQGPGGIRSGITRQRGLAYADDALRRASKFA